MIDTLGLDFVHEMPPEGAFHYGLVLGALFGEVVKRSVRQAAGIRAQRREEQSTE